MNVQQLKIDYYKNNAQDWKSWFYNGITNEEVAGHLNKQYASYYKRCELFCYETIKGVQKRKLQHYKGGWHRYILMFYGLAIECYLKAYLIKNNQITNIVEHKDNLPQLTREIVNHNILNFWKMAFNEVHELDDKEQEIFDNLQRAIKDGKYFIERKFSPQKYAYTAGMSANIKSIQEIIKFIKKKLGN